jgi:hypothetical protein
MNKTFYIFLISFLILALGACSKDKKIERSLVKFDGLWNIDMEHFEIYNDYEVAVSYTVTNIGFMQFLRKEKMIWTYTGGDEHVSSEGVWSNTEDELFMNVDGDKQTYQILEFSKDRIHLFEDKIKPSGSSYSYKTELILSR